jgi:uncharacterized CHY-type Zn-finger protein
MLIATRCTVCQQEIEDEEVITCGDCQKTIHERCAEFERTFRCPECADELDVGAVEF